MSNKTQELIDNLTERNKNALSFLKESINQDTYDKWFKKYNELKSDVDKYSKVLNSEKYKKRKTSMGLIPQEVKDSEEWKEDTANYNNADRAFKFYRKNSPKDYIKKKDKEYKANRYK